MGEFDTPANLVANRGSLLMGFIYQTGAGSSRHLVGIANANVGCETDTTGSTARTSPLSTPIGDGDIGGDDCGESDVKELAPEVAVAVAAAIAAGGPGGCLSPIAADSSTRQDITKSSTVRGRAGGDGGGESGTEELLAEVAVAAAVVTGGRGGCLSPISADVGAPQAIIKSRTVREPQAKVGAEEATKLATIGEGKEAGSQSGGGEGGRVGDGGGSASCRGESP